MLPWYNSPLKSQSLVTQSLSKILRDGEKCIGAENQARGRRGKVDVDPIRKMYSSFPEERFENRLPARFRGSASPRYHSSRGGVSQQWAYLV